MLCFLPQTGNRDPLKNQISVAHSASLLSPFIRDSFKLFSKEEKFKLEYGGFLLPPVALDSLPVFGSNVVGRSSGEEKNIEVRFKIIFNQLM